MLDFKYYSELNAFIYYGKRLEIISYFQYKSYIIATKMYILKTAKVKNLARKIIKKIFSN